MGVNLTAGETYTFSRLGGSSFILDSSDNAHATKYFRNDVVITGSLQVKDNDGVKIFDGSSNDLCAQLFESTDEGYLQLSHDNSVTVRLRANGNSYFLNTNFAIGTSTAGREFEVHANDDDDFISLFRNEATSADANCLRLRIDAATPGTSNNYIQFDKESGHSIDQIEGDGSGGARFTGNSSGTYSDMRNKENILYLDENYKAGDILKQLHVLEYELKTDTRPVKLRHMGFSAQQLLKLWPYPVTKFDKDNEKTGAKPGDVNFKYHKLNQGQMTPLIVKTIQEQMKTIELLTKRVEELEKKLEK